MYIKKIKIQNYRRFNNFEMEFNEGLNVIVGANNAGKTGLLKAVCLMKSPETVSFHDFNKNNIKRYYSSLYRNQAPEIVIDYVIEHKISEDNTDDESIIKLLPFIGMNDVKQSKAESTDSTQYTLTAFVRMKYTLNTKDMARYLEEAKKVSNELEFCDLLERFEKSYTWSYANGVSDAEVDKNEATNIFKIDFIDAERNSDVIYKETKSEIENYLKNDNVIGLLQDLRRSTSANMKEIIKDVLEKIEDLIVKEKNDIGLAYGNIAISQDIRPTTAISSSYIIDVKDTKDDFVLPLTHNGLGYNNLINIYMLIKLVEIKKGRDFRVLCLEEPESHLHPAMQYKLFKFLKKLDEENNLNQQIFVTTHSPNITAVAGLDNMFMLAFSQKLEINDCVQQSLQSQLKDHENSKKHMVKFLDVTRSDMLFADKVILVEGLAEKLLLPKFMDKCKKSYEDYHISIVEIGGKHFDHFLKLFANNSVCKQVLCITDTDFKWTETISVQNYRSEAEHVRKLRETYSVNDNIKIVCQQQYGATFEDELFLANYENGNVPIDLLKIAMPESLHGFIEENGVYFYRWMLNKISIPTKSKDKIESILDIYAKLMRGNVKNIQEVKKMFFARLFLEYAKSKKGSVALDILTNDELFRKLYVPNYIMEGIQWLNK
ncbi:MAG: AAA family ATPase [Erysipelotrichaceae bacterium]